MNGVTICAVLSLAMKNTLSIYMESICSKFLWDNPTDSKYTVSRITEEWNYKNHREDAEYV